jgi:hypothetical protein
MYQVLTGPAGDGSIAAVSDRAQDTLVRKLLPPLSPILLGLVAAKDHEKEQSHVISNQAKENRNRPEIIH